MSLLEDRYRRILRLLPASYRAEREAEMVGAFLEGAGDARDEDNPRPHWSEVASVLALSVRVGLGGVGAAPRFFAWGEAVRLVATLGLAFQATLSSAWLTELLRGTVMSGLGDAGSAQRLWDMAHALTYLMWIAAFILLVRDRPRAAKLSALLALALSYAPIVETGAVLWDGDRSLVPHTVLVVVPVLALLTGFHRDAPRTRRPWRTAALPVVAGVLFHTIVYVPVSALRAPEAVSPAWSWTWPWLGESGLACAALLAASIACFWTRLRFPGGRTASLPLALVILIIPVTLCRASYLTTGAIDPISRTMLAVTAGQVAALLCCAVTLTVLAARSMPALPRVIPSPATPGATSGPAGPRSGG
ncbi:hypothetical protein Ssi03_51420 [Sphaerisporangium siamense]|uniref:Uncharacterized protein n=1 Tax=Sphaerisporangium siamense TaxID=795645 RepID=A0A7W7DA17_9ACTN|nr:hypothetical protein [Sphaerisporangium siamense]MBB4702155.1 hypothetical protein [Sphaerisporangium siamense]GII87152.1 hypothetical protein Ssi03_51420 [Sphaerisporangium siamense]